MAHGTVSLDKVIDKADHTGVLNLAGRNLRQFPMSAQDLSDLQDTLEAGKNACARVLPVVSVMCRKWILRDPPL